MYSPDYVWAKVLNYLENQLTAIPISAYFDDAQVIELTEEKLVLYSPSEFRRNTIIQRYTDYIQDALKEIFNSDAKLVVLDENGVITATSTAEEKKDVGSQLDALKGQFADQLKDLEALLGKRLGD